MHEASYLLYFVIVFVGLLGYILRKAQKAYNYWKEHGVPTINSPHLLYGNLKEAILLKKNSAEVYGEFYQEFKKRGLKHGGKNKIEHFLKRGVTFLIKLILSVRLREKNTVKCSD